MFFGRQGLYMKFNLLKKNYPLVLIAIVFVTTTSLILISPGNKTNSISNSESIIAYEPEIVKSEAEWKQILNPQEYYVLREKGTDPAFSENVLLNEKRAGTFVTADCGEPVFRSEQKYDSGTGWPSFWAPMEGSVVELPDNTFGLTRTEIIGKKCGGHLGHVFTDGPQPKGLRYCINPSALKFIPDPEIQTN